MTLGFADYAVIAVYLAAITAFGSWFARFQKTTRDYFLTDRSVPWWGICFTIVATETSTLTFIGIPALAYAGNWTFLQLAIGYVIGRLLVSVLFIPAYFRGELYTSYELLRRRFGPRVKDLAAGIFLITRTFADGVRLFATALVISIVTQIPVPWSIVIIGAAMIIYTTRGGVAAVIWTDVVQMFVYIAGAGVVFFALLNLIPGGWADVWQAGQAAGKFRVLDLGFDPTAAYTLWAGVLGGVALTLATHGTDQFLVQRLLSARTARAAQAGLILSGVIVFAQFMLFLAIGVMLWRYYELYPLAAPLATNDAVLPTFVVTSLTHGAAGFIVAAIVAAALSPSINSMAATTVNDFYAKYVNPEADEPKLMRVSRIATVFWGVAQIAVALGAQWIPSVLETGLAVLSLAAGPILGAFLVGVLSSRVGGGQILAGIAVGFASLVPIWYYGLTGFTWYAFVGASVTAIVAHLAATMSPRAAGPV